MERQLEERGVSKEWERLGRWGVGHSWEDPQRKMFETAPLIFEKHKKRKLGLGGNLDFFFFFSICKKLCTGGFFKDLESRYVC